MKVTRRFLQIGSGLCILAGAMVFALTRNFHATQSEDAIDYGRWTGIGIIIIGMILLAPWVGSEKK